MSAPKGYELIGAPYIGAADRVLVRRDDPWSTSLMPARILRDAEQVTVDHVEVLHRRTGRRTRRGYRLVFIDGRMTVPIDPSNKLLRATS